MSEDAFTKDAGQVLFELARKYDPDLSSALQRLTEADARKLGVERVSVWLFNADHSAIVCENLFALSRGSHEKGGRLSAGQYPRYFRALEESRLVDAEDARRDPRTSEFTEGYLKPLGIVSMMDAPVRLHGQVVGVVCHEHVGTLRRWTPEEKEFATSIADLASLALEAEERRKLERESEKNLSLLRATLESTADGILVVDRSGRMLSYNQQFVEMWRIPADVLKTRDDEKALAFVLEQLKEPEAFLAKVRELYAQPDVESFDVLEFKDGRIFERYSKPQRVFGEVGGASVGRVWSFRDVTARRRAEEIKTNFASMVSHELKTPLSAIQESVGVVLDGLDGPVTPAQRKTLHIAKANAEWLGRLISNFLTLSKIESGKMAMHYGRVDARSLVEDACRLMKPSADKKGVQLLKFLPAEPVEVQWDADKMRAVVINLIDNAVKYTDAPGHIRVRVAHEAGEVTIEVEDTGIGVREEDKDSIFDMFAQAAVRGPWRTGGFGIGLAICKYMAERHGGSLALESESGKGSRFTVKLPTVRPSECTR
jgi:PAS domain S-box-containing protein